ncbi:PrpF domain-containing protein [Agrobacterium tumefaciens]|uniref:PrpF protein n=1 Tax=Agrobacterium tumefaciens TaxID=358 RepID=A0AA44F6W5_AGRTU|nr:PrpF domain-containing protein [Agrobacterium tumefaciens]NTB87549.1 PrpF protein [Agrobacterium tumefaciens]NTC19756.1 PrpF protein [Agrobacterium tumefaciens]NTC29684.1 PrpF protein [Agrobacterium tumefaciens]
MELKSNTSDLGGPRVNNGIVEFPSYLMRGGTSTGLVIDERHMPTNLELREELLRHLMGVPLDSALPGNRQTTGLGRGPATSNKVFLVQEEDGKSARRLISTLAQLASDHSRIDWSVNCGNMSAALPLWALDSGLLEFGANGEGLIEIRNTNTGLMTEARMSMKDGQLSTAEIAGVDGSYPAVDLFLRDPIGSKTGMLLPTGSAQDSVLGHRVSCVDVAVPMVIVDAASFGMTASEPMRELEANSAFMRELKSVWVQAGLRMALKRRDGELLTEEELSQSETVPKVCIVGPPTYGGDIAVRYFTPQTAHASMAVSGGCCLAAASLIPGTVASDIARDLPALHDVPSDVDVGIENPAGILEATVTASMSGGAVSISRAAYRRSAQILMRGYTPIYRASPQLREALARSA